MNQLIYLAIAVGVHTIPVSSHTEDRYIQPPIRPEQSVLVDDNGKAIYNFAIDSSGRAIDLEPYFNHDPDAENRIQLRYDNPPNQPGQFDHDCTD